MQLGREAIGAKQAPVYVMPRMASFLTNNGPWSQLVSLDNIVIHKLRQDSSIIISNSIKVTPFLVPHRDEYSETVGFKIESANLPAGQAGKKILFIPDIDKWEKWQGSIVDEVRNSDMAFIDGTFFKDGELPGRSMKEVPHPFVQETMNLFSALPPIEKKKIFFIHFNHTNPLIWDKATQQNVRSSGFNYATEGMIVDL
jgi:pyrroloquinoline quinone biosynthesis protein B